MKLIHLCDFSSRFSFDVGLFISSSIAELHGGVLLARSDGLGRGSTLSLLLPLYRQPEPATGSRDIESAGVRV